LSILVTGSAGFIGFAVCRQLLDAGETVVGLDNLNDAYDPKIKLWRLDQTSRHPAYHFHQLDLSDFSSLKKLFEQYSQKGTRPFDSIINLGARAGVLQSLENPWVYISSNTTGALNLMELCKDFGVGKFVLASTSSVYGSETERPFSESSSTSRPVSPYASSKKAAETLAYTYHDAYGLDATVLRFFTVYGPAGRPDMSIFMFIRAIFEGEPITLFGDGGQRDFTFVDDVARGVIAAQRPLGYEIVNLGGDRPIVITDVIKMLEEEIGREAVIEYGPRASADIQATWANIDRANRLLDWQPRVSMEEGLSLTIQWYRDNRDWAKDLGKNLPA
jgi:nucleoside-diphosphate-sugar epimerase